jgi:hypothetical protein
MTALDGKMATLGAKVKRKSQMNWHEMEGESEDVPDGALHNMQLFAPNIMMQSTVECQSHRGNSVPSCFLFRGFCA